MHLSAPEAAAHAGPSPQGSTVYLWFIASVAALGGLLFGYDWVVIGGARQFYEEWFHLGSAALVGWANSCALLGCLAGSLLFGYLGDWQGRQRLLLVAALLFTVSSIATGWAGSFSAFIVWRIVGGVAIGLASGVAPVYIAEISPAASRGRLVSLNQFAVVVGILLAQIVNALIARSESGAGALAAHHWNVSVGWRWMFSAVAFPAVLFFFGALALPESPRWLMARGDPQSALRTLQRIVGARAAALDLAEMSSQIRTDSSEPSRWREFLRRGYRRPLLLAVAIAVLQQWSGINILFNYAGEVYRSAGYAAGDILLNIVITGSINLLATILAMFLVDTVGRRKLMLFGCVGIGASQLLCALAYRQHWPGLAVLILTLTAIACYACTLAPVTWVLISEIFPMKVRARGMSLAGGALWIASFLLTYTFPLMLRGMGMEGTFTLYAAVCLAGFVLVATSVRETRGVSLERIGQ
jgi:SP family xylose:H+ symportor-like MFS transporter